MSMTTEIRLEETFTPVKNPFYGKMVTKKLTLKRWATQIYQSKVLY